MFIVFLPFIVAFLPYTLSCLDIYDSISWIFGIVKIFFIIIFNHRIKEGLRIFHYKILSYRFVLFFFNEEFNLKRWKILIIGEG